MVKKWFLPKMRWWGTVILIILVLIVIITISYLIYSYYKERYTVIKAPKKMIELKPSASLFKESPVENVLFEPVDIIYYQDQPQNLIDYINFDLTEGTVDIPNVDSQNIHDTIVQNGIRKIWSTFFGDTPVNNDPAHIKSTFKEIKKAAGDDTDVISVLDTIKKRNDKIVNLGDTDEMNVLVNVWDYIKDNVESKSFLLENLKEAFENGKTVCPTGTVSRIVSTLALDEPERFPKTKEIIHNEMMNTAAKMRSDLLTDNTFVDLSEDQQTSQFKDSLISKFTDDYSGILTPENIHVYTKDWIDYV